MNRTTFERGVYPFLATVSLYRIRASHGKPARLATKVTFSDGCEVAFTERLSKSQALNQATLLHEVDERHGQ